MDQQQRRKLEEAASTLRAVRENTFRVSTDVCESLALERAEKLIRDALEARPSRRAA